jgi:very-short-patch-repair endonuclease
MPQLDGQERGTTGTSGHRALHRFLVEAMGFVVEDEHPAGRYSIDCYAEEVHAGFEYDGRDFHASTAQRRRDAERDAWILGELGIPIMRFTDADLLKGKRAGMFEAVDGWLGAQEGLAERRARARGKR